MKKEDKGLVVNNQEAASVNLQGIQFVQEASGANYTSLEAGQGVTRAVEANLNIPGASIQATNVTKELC
ncbi:hypothetical protein E3N88_08749 [Mikania micrantha]|uniref:Uncharacterized protein n=1 Tax=Mikania micrantha TaxID=192012 RepID=A0A5N6PJE4_9ASTR|nr:hypothetical protein E3N88_08749 [Mikania micrantha]